VGVCHVAEKGQLGGLRWVLARQILEEGRGARSAKEPA